MALMNVAQVQIQAREQAQGLSRLSRSHHRLSRDEEVVEKALPWVPDWGPMALYELAPP